MSLSLAARTSAGSASRLLTPRDVADRLAVSVSMVRKLAMLGELPPVYIGRLPRFEEADVLVYLDRQRARALVRT